MTWSTAARNASLSAIAALVDGGSGPGKLKLKASSTVLVVYTLEDPAFGPPASGSMTAEGFPMSEDGVADGAANSYELCDSSDTVIASGSVSGTGGSGDVELENPAVQTGVPVTVDALVITQPSG